MRGTVVKFDTERGFGFIRVPDHAEDVFVHISAVDDRQELRVGQRVTFDVTQSEKGPQAVNVTSGRVSHSPYVIFGTIAALLTIAGSGLLRVPERTLQGLALLFGSPGAWVSQQLFHHKTHKEPFRTWFRVIVVVQGIAIIGLIWWIRT